MKRIDLVSARLTDVGLIASRMRYHDARECRALGRAPKQGLRAGLRMSMKPTTILIDDYPEGMFGVVPVSMVAGKGVPWLLGTNELYRYPRAWALLGPRVAADMLATFRQLENVVSVDNDKAIRFLRHLGFTVSGSVRFCGGVGFVPFHMERAIQEASVPA